MSDSAGGFTPRVSRPASRTRMDRHYTARSHTWLKDEFLRFRALRPAVRDAEPVRWYEALLRAMEVADRTGEEAPGPPDARTAAPGLTDVNFQIERLRRMIVQLEAKLDHPHRGGGTESSKATKWRSEVTTLRTELDRAIKRRERLIASPSRRPPAPSAGSVRTFVSGGLPSLGRGH